MRLDFFFKNNKTLKNSQFFPFTFEWNGFRNVGQDLLCGLWIIAGSMQVVPPSHW